jgi:hypothetical protein
MTIELCIPESYFVSLRRKMIGDGYAVLCDFSCDSNEAEYHVKTKYARVTTMAFHHRVKRMIFWFQFYENCGLFTMPYCFHISLNQTFETLSLGELRRKLHIHPIEDSYFDYYDRPIRYPLITGIETEVEIPNWRYHRGSCRRMSNRRGYMTASGCDQYGRHYEYNTRTQVDLSPEDLCGVVKTLFDGCSEYVESGKWAEIWLHEFLPSYVFDRFNTDVEFVRRKLGDNVKYMKKITKQVHMPKPSPSRARVRI